MTFAAELRDTGTATNCDGCGEWFTRDVLTDGRCTECRLTDDMAELAARDAEHGGIPMTKRHDFLDPISGAMCTLVIDESAAGEHGVQHPDCTDLAAVSPSIDAFYCETCHTNGRVSGAWVLDLWRAHQPVDWVA